MARKPPDWHQPSLFAPDPATNAGQAPPNTPEPEDKSYSKPEGDQHAVQDHSPRTPATTDGASRTATPDAQAPADTGDLRSRAEDQPRSLEGNARSGEAGQRPEP